jgi:hypothetical protein
MIRKYEIYSRRRIVSTEYSINASQAVIDYVRRQGVKDAEIVRLGVDSVSWRGARFSAVLVPAESHIAE